MLFITGRIDPPVLPFIRLCDDESYPKIVNQSKPLITHVTF